MDPVIKAFNLCIFELQEGVLYTMMNTPGPGLDVVEKAQFVGTPLVPPPGAMHPIATVARAYTIVRA